MASRDPSMCVIFNGASGKGRADRRLERVRRDLGDRAEFRPTTAPGHAVELARQAALDGFAQVVAAGGDGTVHEVVNGLMHAARPDVELVVAPIGSANDFAHTLLQSTEPTIRIDVGRACANGRDIRREKFFVCNLGMGFNGRVTAESRGIRVLQGMALYGWATLRALGRGFTCPDMDLHLDDRAGQRGATLMVAVFLAQREGGFLMAPDARLDDGWFDIIQVAALSRLRVLSLLPRLALLGPPHSKQIRRDRCRSIRIVTETSVHVHVDGEFLCLAEEDCREIEAEIVPGALAVDVAATRRLATL